MGPSPDLKQPKGFYEPPWGPFAAVSCCHQHNTAICHRPVRAGAQLRDDRVTECVYKGQGDLAPGLALQPERTTPVTSSGLNFPSFSVKRGPLKTPHLLRGDQTRQWSRTKTRVTINRTAALSALNRRTEAGNSTGKDTARGGCTEAAAAHTWCSRQQHAHRGGPTEDG